MEMITNKEKPSIKGLYKDDILSSLSAKRLKAGSTTIAARILMKSAETETINDSDINCQNTWPFTAPTTLRIPTSFALSIDRAVLKLIYVKQAMSNISKATAPTIYT